MAVASSSGTSPEAPACSGVNQNELAPVYRHHLGLVLRPRVVLSGRQGGQRAGQRESPEEDAGPWETVGLWERALEPVCLDSCPDFTTLEFGSI